MGYHTHGTHSSGIYARHLLLPPFRASGENVSSNNSASSRGSTNTNSSAHSGGLVAGLSARSALRRSSISVMPFLPVVLGDVVAGCGDSSMGGDANGAEPPSYLQSIESSDCQYHRM
jgi:hypothetical protein